MATYFAVLQYNANGGGGAPASQSDFSSSPHQTKWFTVSSVKPSRTYYTFLGWSRSSGATSASYTGGSSISIYTGTDDSPTNTATLYAVWQHQTAYVYYNANGGTGAPATQSHWAGYSVTLSATTPTRAGYDFLGWATSASATTPQYQPNTSYALYTTVTLYAVWKASVSTLTASNGTMGTAMTIGITRQVNSYKDTITYKFGSVTGTIVTKTSSNSVSWTPPTTLASQIPNASSGSLVLTCTTYSGDTVIGTSTKTVSLSVPQSLAPTVSVSYADTDATCLSWGVYVQSRSKLAFSISATGQESATIASYSTSVNGTTYTGNSFTTDVLLYNGSNSYTVTVTDSRGLQKVVTGTFSVEAYGNPSLTLTLCDRDDNTDSTINVEFDFLVSSVQNNNSAQYAIDYKLKSSSTWTNGTVQALGGYSGTITDSVLNRDGGDEWDIRVRVIDSFTTVSIISEVGVSGNILLNSRHQGGLGILMKSQADNQLDVGKKTVFHETIDVIPRRAYATLSSAGWYRVLSYTCNLSSEALGAEGFVIDFDITRTYNNTNNEVHHIKLLGVYNNIVWTDEASKSNTQYIDKIRYTYNGTNAYVDVHYTGSTANQVSVMFDVKTKYSDLSWFSAESLQAIADAPSGETILSTQTFFADKMVGSFGTPVTISTFPYTVKEDGFMWVEMRCSSTGRLYTNFIGAFICDGYTVAGGYINGTFPVKKGTTLPTPSESNLQSVKYTWYPLG